MDTLTLKVRKKELDLKLPFRSISTAQADTGDPISVVPCSRGEHSMAGSLFSGTRRITRTLHVVDGSTNADIRNSVIEAAEGDPVHKTSSKPPANRRGSKGKAVSPSWLVPLIPLEEPSV